MLTAVTTPFLLGAVALISLPVLLFLLQVVCATWRRPAEQMTEAARPRLTVLVPAHNEAGGIRATLESVGSQLAEADSVLVVADNCSDDTAAVATAAGAHVVERVDPTYRGKGYALDFGVGHLSGDPPDVVVVIDADCLVAAGTLERIARRCQTAGRPVQARYLMAASAEAGPMGAIAEFAWLVKNHVRPLGYQRLGLPCHMMGSGMAFPWAVIRSLPLGSGHLVEDVKMGLDLTESGLAPIFCPDSLVSSTFPVSREGTQSQRIRWEHGHLGVIASEAPQYLLRALRSGNRALIALVLDVCIPPLALLTLLVLGACAVGLAYYAASGVAHVLLAALLVLSWLILAVLLAWACFGRRVLPLILMVYAPLYSIRKIPLYLKFLVSRQVEWIRSRRD